jgi:hypothetical protein
VPLDSLLAIERLHFSCTCTSSFLPGPASWSSIDPSLLESHPPGRLSLHADIDIKSRHRLSASLHAGFSSFNEPAELPALPNLLFLATIIGQRGYNSQSEAFTNNVLHRNIVSGATLKKHYCASDFIRNLEDSSESTSSATLGSLHYQGPN